MDGGLPLFPGVLDLAAVFLDGVLPLLEADFANFFAGDLDRVLPRGLAGDLDFLAGVLARDLATDLLGVLPRDFDGVFPGLFDFFAEALAGVFRTFADNFDAFAGVLKTSADFEGVFSYLDGEADFFAVLSRFFDLPSLSSSCIDSSALSSWWAANPKIATLVDTDAFSPFFSTFTTFEDDLDFLSSFVLITLVDLDLYRVFVFFSFFVDFDLA